MNTIFMNAESSDSDRLLLNLIDKIDLKERINILLSQIFCYTWENVKNVIEEQ